MSGLSSLSGLNGLNSNERLKQFKRIERIEFKGEEKRWLPSILKIFRSGRKRED